MKKLPFEEVMRRVNERDVPEKNYLNEENLLLNKLYAHDSAGIARRVELEDLQHWGLMSPDGELRPDLAIPEISKEHGNAVWRLINAYLP